MSQSHNDMIAVVAAHRDGKEIEYRYLRKDPGEIDQWLSMEPAHGRFQFEDFEYRIAPTPPKPREWWIAIYPDSAAVGYESKAEALRYHPHAKEIIRVIEETPSSFLPSSREQT